MAVVLMILCVIASLFIHAGLADARAPIRSRGSLRYQRRKARRQGLPVDLVEVRQRPGAVHDWGEPIGTSHVADLAWSFSLLIGVVVVTIFGLLILGAFVSGIGSLVWCLLVIFAALVLNRRRSTRRSSPPQ